MSDPITIATFGMIAMFALIFLHVPIGVSLGLVGVLGSGLYIGFDAAFSLIEIETAAAISNDKLALVAIFLLMGSFATVAGQEIIAVLGTS